MQAHGLQQVWPLQSPELLDGVAQLCLHKVRSLQAVLANCSSHYVQIRWLQQHLGPARTLHRSLDRKLISERKNMNSHARELLRWVHQLRLSVQHLHPHGDVASTEAALQSVGLSAGKGVAATIIQGVVSCFRVDQSAACFLYDSIDTSGC
jgi:hypothetical protein